MARGDAPKLSVVSRDSTRRLVSIVVGIVDVHIQVRRPDLFPAEVSPGRTPCLRIWAKLIGGRESCIYSIACAFLALSLLSLLSCAVDEFKSCQESAVR